jgi:uncharacterized protein (UPF0332 family)
MSEIQALLLRATESVAAARGLLRDGYPDFAASRAYYAMLYVAEALLAHLGQSYSSHAAAIGAYGREYAKTGKLDARFHRWLIEAQNLRGTSATTVSSPTYRHSRRRVCASGPPSSYEPLRASWARKAPAPRSRRRARTDRPTGLSLPPVEGRTRGGEEICDQRYSSAISASLRETGSFGVRFPAGPQRGGAAE